MDADAGLVRFVVVLAQETDFVRGHHRQVQGNGQRHSAAQVPFFLRPSRALQLDVETSGKGRLPPLRAHLGQGAVALCQGLADIAAASPAEQDQPIAVLLEQPGLNAAVVLVAQIAGGDQLNQVLVTGGVHGQHRQRKGLAVFAQHFQVRADDRLDPFVQTGLVKLDQPEQVAEIGQRHRWLALGPAPPGERLDAHDTVSQGVLAVHAQMHEGRPACGGHDAPHEHSARTGAKLRR